MDSAKYKCPNCGSKAKTFLYITSTTMGFSAGSYDKKGVWHKGYDPNIVSENWRCGSCNQQYTISTRNGELIK